MINLEQCIVDLKNSKYWNLLFQKYKVLMIQVVGSQLTGHTDDRSDVDIVVVCEDSPEYQEPITRLSYEGHSVHWYYINYRNYFELSEKQILRQVNQYTVRFTEYSNILYVTDRFKPALDYIMSNKLEISKIGAQRFITLMRSSIANTIENNLSERYYTKWISHILIAYSVLTDIEVNSELLRAIKRIRWLPTTAEEREECCKLLRDVQNYVVTEQLAILTELLTEHLNRIVELVK